MNTNTSVQNLSNPLHYYLSWFGIFWTIVIVVFALWDQLFYSLGADREELHAQALIHLAAYGGIWLIGILALRAVGKSLRNHLTERHQAAEILRRNESFTQSILNSVVTQIAVLDRDGVILAVNEPWRRFARENSIEPGKPAPGTDIGSNYLGACRGGDGTEADGALEARNGIRAVLDGSLPSFSLEYPCHSPQQQRWFSMSATPLGDARQGGVVIAHTDISERKQAVMALIDSEARFRDFFEKNFSTMLLIDPDSGKIIGANKAAIDYYGYPPERLVGMHLNEINTLPQKRIAEEMHEALHEARSHFHFSHRLASGEVRDVEVHSTPIESGGRTVLLSIILDITERRRAEAERAAFEAQLRESQKMEAIGTLAGGIARDFNNAVATILGNIELAREDAKSNPPALVSLEEIRKAGTRARDLVQQILAFSRRRPTELRPTALTAVVEQSASLLRAALPVNTTLDVCCGTDVPAVLADVTQIEQVLLNLATNAMQAMHGSPGHIHIGLDSALLDAALAEAHPELRAMHTRRPGLTVRLAVSDNGPGMDAATLARIFEPFFTTRKGDEATGMGLAVVHGIVQAHAGAMVVDSRLGKGSTFTLYLPRAQVHVEAPPQPPLTAAASPALDTGGTQHILYIDDDEALVFLMQRLLERRGFRISGYSSQREALAALRAQPEEFDLVVSDYNMPGMSGLDVAREVRAIRADLPLAIASGFIDEYLRTEAPAAGVRELIFKADVAEDLCEALARLARTLGEKSRA